MKIEHIIINPEDMPKDMPLNYPYSFVVEEVTYKPFHNPTTYYLHIRFVPFHGVTKD